jgi:hypothetical protein
MKEFLVVTLLTLVRIMLWLGLVLLFIIASPLLTIFYNFIVADDILKKC